MAYIKEDYVEVLGVVLTTFAHFLTLYKSSKSGGKNILCTERLLFVGALLTPKAFCLKCVKIEVVI